jgi:hypothetical protein
MDQNSDQKPYASGRLRALLTILLLGAVAASAALSMSLNVTRDGMFRSVADHNAPSKLGKSVTEMLYVGIAILQFVIFVVTVVAFLMWLHRAYRNLPALGAVGLDTTPGWAVGCFFIPFANFFKPFRVVREIWHESAPVAESRESSGGVAAQQGTPALVGWWWAFCLIANIAGLAGIRAEDTAATIEGMLLASWLLIASDALFIVAAVLSILIVKRIDEMQEAKFRQLAAQRPPPPPESFL